MIPGTKVKMSEDFKYRFTKNNVNIPHIQEFGKCIGIVIGHVKWSSGEGPEVDVRWQPSNLRYMYDPTDLEIVTDKEWDLYCLLS